MRPLAEENYSPQTLIQSSVKVYIRPGFDPLYGTTEEEKNVGKRIKKILEGKWGIVVGSDTVDGIPVLHLRFPWLRESLCVEDSARTLEDIHDGDQDWYIKDSDLSFYPWKSSLTPEQKDNINQALQTLNNLGNGTD